MRSFHFPLAGRFGVLFQLLGGLLLIHGIGVINSGGLLLPGSFAPTTFNTVVMSALAVIVGFMFFYRVVKFPGVRSGSYVFPIYSLAFGASLAVILLGRLDYSRVELVSGYIATLIWFHAMYFFSRRAIRHRLAVIPAGKAEDVSELRSVDWKVLGSPQVRLDSIQGVVVDLRADLSPEWERFIADCAVSGIQIYDVRQVTESMTGRVEINHLSENTLGSLNPDDAYLMIKQAVDWLASLLLLILLLPLLVVVGAVIRLDSPGPALFRQKRMGYRGRVFTAYKFRTMVHRPEVRASREEAITRDDDKRITGLGQFLRKSRIDELPQLFNVLRGDMSLIGPRPEALVLSKWYEESIPFYRYRHIVRPGVTGWAQVMQGHVTDVDDVQKKLQYDFYYIKNFSPWLDLLIVLKTLRTMLTGWGAR